MTYIKFSLQITGQIIFVITFIFFSTLHAKNLDRFEKGGNISDYFFGVLLLNQNQYNDSHKFLKKLDGLEASHNTYSSKFLYSLVNSGNFNQAFNYSKKLERDGIESFETDLIIGIYYLKNSKHNLANKYFLKAKQRNSRSVLENYIAHSLSIWSNLNNYKLSEATESLKKLDNRFQNLKKIQEVFINCFYNSSKTEFLFDELVSNSKTDFSRYNYFYAKYLESLNKSEKSDKIINQSLKLYPRNLLLNYHKTASKNQNVNLNFNCKKQDHVAAEIIYIAANALSSQSIFTLSNFYLYLAKYLNKEFHTFDTLLAENFFKIKDYSTSKKIYNRLSKNGRALEWYSQKQISRILIIENDVNKSIKLFQKAFNNLEIKGVYETFDYAEFLKNNEQFEEAIGYYTKILNQINKDHSLYPDAKDGRGIAYERTDQWEKAEKDLLDSLDVSPNQAYVINYLAYSWIEQGIKIEKSLKMLEKANDLKSNDPYIIDSLGWALYKLKRYKESKDYLKRAVKLMPADPIVNDHYGDVLWKNGNKIQARYYWEYVLNLKKVEKDLKEKIEKKLIKGL